MAIDYGEKERQFLESLKEETGRSLDEWMNEIQASGLEHRNDVIDWLRQQGFLFSKASWIERIHNNGGKPIYGDRATGRTRPARRDGGARLLGSEPQRKQSVAPVMGVRPLTEPGGDASRPRPSLRLVKSDVVPAASTAPAPPAVTAVPVAQSAPPPAADDASSDALEALLKKAKAYRPLATFVLSEIRKTVPDIRTEIRGAFVLLSKSDTPFGGLHISSKDVRLGLVCAAAPQAHGFQDAKFGSGAPAAVSHFTHMIVLTDARQVNSGLLEQVRASASQG